MDGPSLVISAIALVVAAASFWTSSLRPFRLVVLNSAPTLHIYEIPPTTSGTADGKTWWIPSLDAGVSFYNTGSRAGNVEGLQFAVTINQTMGGTLRYEFGARCVVDFGRYDRLRADRFKWLDTAVEKDWYPVLLLDHGSQDQHVVFELSGRWDNKFEGQMELHLLAKSGGTWRRIATYQMRLTEEMFGSHSSWSAAPPPDSMKHVVL